MRLLKSFFSFLILLLLFGSSLSLCAQNRTSREGVVVRYAYNIALKVVWPNEANMTAFRIVFVGDGRKLKAEFRKLAKSARLKNQAIRFIEVDDVSRIPECEMVFLSPSLNDSLSQVYKRIGRKPVLILTDHHKDKSSVMVNLMEDKKKKQLSFEVNRANIIFQRLEMQLDLLKWGGEGD